MVTVKSCCRSLLLVFVAVIAATSFAAVPRVSAVDTVVDPEVRQRALQTGPIRVIAQMRLAGGKHLPEGLLAHAEIQAQRSDISNVRTQILARLAKHSHRVVHQYDTIPLIALEVGFDGLQELEAAGLLIERVVVDRLHAPSLPESIPLTGTDQAWSRGFDGTGTVVAIVDTGVQATHPFLSGKVIEEACYSSTTANSVTVCPNGQNQQIGPGAGVNCSVTGCSHGTHVAGIAAGDGAGAGVTFSGMAKGARIMAVQVFSRFDNPTDCGGTAPCVLAWTSDIIAGLERVYAVRGTRSIVAANLSLGGGGSSAACDSDPTKAIIDNLRSAGIATVVAAGNDGLTNSLNSPACVSTAISVGATTKSDVIASFSNVSPLLSLLAPGQSIYSSLPGGTFGFLSGTSMATPHVTGAWAVLKQAVPTGTVDRILSALQDTGVAVTDTRVGGTVTKRRINVVSALTVLTGTATLTVSPTTAMAGGNVTATWSGIVSPTPTDWIGLYTPGAGDGSARAWLYVSCSPSATVARSSGSCLFPLPAALTAGSYELRLFAANGFTRLATSGPFTVTASTATAVLSEAPASVAAGSSVTATWSGIVSPTATDWIGLYAPGAADSSALTWIYVSCSKSPGAARASGSCALAVPGGLAAGTYELRLFAANGFTRLATSGPFTVTASTGTPTLSGSPASVGSFVTATWSGITSPTASDWIGLYAPGAADGSALSWVYVSCSKSPDVAHANGSCSLPVPAGLSGSYELRLFASNGFTRLATSATFIVTPSGAASNGRAVTSASR